MVCHPSSQPLGRRNSKSGGVYRKTAGNSTRLPDPKPQREDWLNLYAYADATTVRPSTGDTPRWKTLGAAPATESPDEPPPEIIGLAIASPLFALSAGERQITISLGFYDDDGGPLIAPGETAFSVQVSTAKGWAVPTGLEILSGANADYTKLDGIAMIPAGVTLLGLRLRLRDNRGEQAIGRAVRFQPLHQPPE